MARQVVERLRQDGHQIEYITEGPRGRDDTDIIDLANHSAAIVLTDDKDFGELVVRQGLPVQGVILVRLEGVDPARRAEIVSNAIRAHESELVGGFMVVTSSRIRIRRLHA